MWHTGLTTRRVLASAVKKIDSVSELLIHAGGWGWEWQMTNYTTMCKKRKGRKSVTSKFVRFEGVKLFALFAVIKFRRGSKTAINYGCKRIGFQRAAAADMSFFLLGRGLDTIKEFNSDYLSCKRRAVKNKLTGPLCCCTVLLSAEPLCGLLCILTARRLVS